jgi:hypothetical protein
MRTRQADARAPPGLRNIDHGPTPAKTAIPR